MMQGFFNKPIIAMITLMIAMIFITLNDVLVKILSADMVLFQILLTRTILSLLVISCLPGFFKQLYELSISVWWILFFRGSLLVFALLFFFTGLSLLPIGENVAIFFISPFIIVIASAFFLKEKLTIYKLITIIIGFIGTLLIIKPGTEYFNVAYFFPLVASLFYSMFQLYTRYIRHVSPLLIMVGVQQLCYLIWTMILAPIFYIIGYYIIGDNTSDIDFLTRAWIIPNGTQFLYMIIAGGCVLLLAFAASHAYRLVQASYVAPLEYITLPISAILGYIIWDDQLDIYSYIGIIFIIFAGIFIVFLQQKSQH